MILQPLHLIVSIYPIYELLQSSYNDALRNNLLWISQIKTLLESKGMLDEFLRNDRDTPYTNILIFQRLCDEFHQNAFATIQDETSKLRTYSLFKSKIGFENYLNTIKNKAIRTEITRFRLSNHQLMIEIGRHRKIPKNLRFCPFCPDTIETEIHFLISCPTYNHNREILTEYFHTLNPSFILYTELKKFQNLFANIEDPETYTFISNCIDLFFMYMCSDM